MKLSRRDFIHAGCTVAGATLVPSIIDRAEAFWHGSAGIGLSLRNVLNVNDFAFGTTDYAMINHVLPSTGVVPNNATYLTGKTWPQVLDANGWPNDAAASGQQFFLQFVIPDPANFAGPYRLDWQGNGEVDIHFFNNTGGTPTATNLVNMTQGANTFVWISSGGASTASVDLTFAATSPSGPVTGTLEVSVTGTSGFFVKNIRLYRVSDATDLAAGKIWRTGWKQPIVNLCPSAVRFMNLLGGNSDVNCRFENRTLPSNATYTGGTGGALLWTASPVYPAATGTNQYTIGTATPTTANPKTTPASMVHGELATILFVNGIARVTANLSISSVTNAVNGVVTTSSNHGFSTGDVIIHFIELIQFINGNLNGTTSIGSVSDVSNLHIGMYIFGPGIPANTTITNIVGSTLTISNAATITLSQGHLAFRSMNNLHLFPCTITVTAVNTYQLNVNTTAFGTFFAPPGSSPALAMQFVTAQVGSGNDRTAYPICFGDGTPAAFFNGTYLDANSYKTLTFDKTISAKTDGAGNYILGAWTMPATPSQGYVGHGGDMPIEACVALVNELNAMSPAHTIGMWMNIPAKGLSSMDPDYTTASDWAKNAVDVVMNPSSVVRAGGFSALGYSGASQLNQPNLIIEYSNEVWNGTNNDAQGWCGNRSIQRWPTITGLGDFQDMQALRSTVMARDIKGTSPPGASRIKYVIGMWGTVGINPAGDFGNNYAKAFGGNVTATPVNFGDWYTNDTLVTGGSWGRPIDNHDGVCPATYFDPPDSYYTTITGTGTFTDDSAMFNGTNNTVNGGGNYTGAANPSQAITNYVAQVVDAGNVHSSESTTRYATVVMPNFATTMPAGKVVLNYEGGTDWPTQTGQTAASGNYTLTAANAAFLIAVIDSSQWATAQVNFLNAVNGIAKCFMPSIYIWIAGVGQRWSYCTPDSYATISSTPTEGAALTVNSPVWIAMGNRNQALSP